MNFTELMVKTSRKLSEETALRAFSPGSIARGILETYNSVAVDIATTLNMEIVNNTLSTATGDTLTALGKLFGIERVGATYAVGEVEFAIDPYSGKTLNDLKDILRISRDADIVLPSGLDITTRDKSIVYHLAEDVVLKNEPSRGRVVSALMGRANNVPAGALNTLPLIPTSLRGIEHYIVVTNREYIDNASDPESDENFRYRIVNAFTTAAKANETAIRLACLSVPGVANCFVRPYEYGIGTVGIFVLSESPIVSDGILNAVRQVAQSVAAAGERIIVTAPRYVALAMDIVLQFRDGMTTTQKDSICNDFRDAIILYINNLGMGEPFVLGEVRSLIRVVTDTVHDLVIKNVGFGEYNKSTGLIDHFEPTMATRLSILATEKFVSNRRLITVCYEE